MLRLSWTVVGSGSANCTFADQDAEVTVEGSYIAETPGELLTAVARVVTSVSEARADFEAEPTGYRLVLRRDGEDVWMRVLGLPSCRSNDLAGTELWASRQPVDVLARTVIRCFDDVARTCGEDEYHRQWRRPFPRLELEALRTVWRARRAGR
jgi:hypothetical protein